MIQRTDTMFISIYQIQALSPKITKTMFSLGATPEKINPSIYKKVYEGVIPEQDLNEIFKTFNENPPNDYTGRSLSVSDIITIGIGKNKKSYYIDNVSFNEIPFEYPNDTYAYINKDQVLKLVKDIHGFCRNDVLNDLIIRINNLPTIVLPKKD